ncbi:hypothetical protein [Amycolatopsis sp. cmx-11-51]|uniref:hypothetical protein n=1 Tax=Amycolatopsis sp. cmx-11-51 TaxID=2785797 RepID=UPI0039E48572
METEEILRSYPIDGGPDGRGERGHWRTEVLGSGTDLWKYRDDKRAGMIGGEELSELERGLARSPGTCTTMGTAPR